MKGLNDYAKEIHKASVKRGFYEKPLSRGERLMLVVSELCEALEADRNDNYCNLEAFDEVSTVEPDFKAAFKGLIKDSYQDEIADSIIRLLDLVAYEGIDIERHLQLKLKYNETRPYKHGKRY